MNNFNPFVRKIIYIACIGGLLIPLSLVSRPEIRDGDGAIDDGGGQLSKLREKYNLSQAKIADIDPASETMKLASLGLRGVAVNMLWMQAMEQKKLEQYDKLASTLQALTKIQPSFVKVWEYQAHNLAYNVSMEFDDYEQRYQWVQKGISFLKRGIPYNKRDHRVTDQMGFFTGNKFGKSDEHLQFRRMFRKDDDFHQQMSDFIDPDTYDEREYGHDSWRLSYQWYDYSLKMVEEQSCPQRTGDMLFYMNRPSQLRNQAITLQEEYRSEEVIQNIWAKADAEWMIYGNQKISNTIGNTITLEGLAGIEAEIEVWRKKMDALVEPGSRQEIMEDLMAAAQLTDEQKMVMKILPDERNDEQTQMVRNINQRLWSMDQGIENKLAFAAPDDKREEALKISLKIAQLQSDIRAIDKDSSTVNYRYWRSRNKAEAEDIASIAHQALYDAKQMWRQSIYDDEYDVDYKTKEKTITKRGAISLYIDAFSKWAEIFEKYPELKDGHLAEEVFKGVKAYNNMLITTNREWPLDFPLQKVIDDRFAAGEQDGMPTTDMIQEMYSGRTDEAFEKLVNAGPVRYQASHILVEEEAKAKKIIVELDGGADFAELAKKYSTGPSGAAGGSLGWFGEGKMVAEFTAAVKELEIGAYSAMPVKTQFGWHIIKLSNRRGGGEQAKPDEPASEMKTEETTPDEKKTDEAMTKETPKSEDVKPDETKPEDPKSDEAKSDKTKTEEAKSDESKSGESKSKPGDEAKSQAPKVDEIKPGETAGTEAKKTEKKEDQ